MLSPDQVQAMLTWMNGGEAVTSVQTMPFLECSLRFCHCLSLTFNLKGRHLGKSSSVATAAVAGRAFSDIRCGTPWEGARLLNLVK